MTRFQRVFTLIFLGLSSIVAAALFPGGQSEKGSSYGQASSSQDMAVVQAATQANQERNGPQTHWMGPTSGPKATPGKKVIYVTNDSRNALQVVWGKAMEEAAAKIGWTVTTLDGQGTVNGWTAAFSQAIASNPDGIVTACDAASIQGPMTDAFNRKIPVIGLHAAANPGPDSSCTCGTTSAPAAWTSAKPLRTISLRTPRARDGPSFSMTLSTPLPSSRQSR